MTAAQSLSLDDVASHLGVHYQTVYRWIRAGRLRAVKVGGAYVVSPADLDQMLADRNAPVDPPEPGSERLDRQSAAMLRALLEGEETEAANICRTLRSNGTPVTSLISNVLVPPLVEIGARWHRGELPIFVEHRASGIVERVLGSLSPNPRGRRRGRVMVGAVTGDRHQLPTAMAAAALREDNWHVEHLGADMPPAELISFAQSHSIELGVLSASTDDSYAAAETAAGEITAVVGIPVLVGGAGMSLQRLQSDARTVTSGV